MDLTQMTKCLEKQSFEGPMTVTR